MNPCVPDHDGIIDGWYKAFNSMFGEVVECNTGAFDADLSMTPPFVTQMPPRDMTDCFIFNEVITNACVSYKHAEIMLIEHIEDRIDRDMTKPRDTSKATIVWRIKPEIIPNGSSWKGYARLRVLDKHSQLGYFC